MASFQEDFYLQTSSPWRRLGRDLRLLVYILQMVWFWGIHGGRVRRRIRRARRTGQPYYVDDLARWS